MSRNIVCEITEQCQYTQGSMNGYVAAVVGIDFAYVLYALYSEIHYICISFLGAI
jgi:hypothetical protein